MQGSSPASPPMALSYRSVSATSSPEVTSRKGQKEAITGYIAERSGEEHSHSFSSVRSAAKYLPRQIIIGEQTRMQIATQFEFLY